VAGRDKSFGNYKAGMVSETFAEVSFDKIGRRGRADSRASAEIEEICYVVTLDIPSELYNNVGLVGYVSYKGVRRGVSNVTT